MKNTSTIIIILMLLLQSCGSTEIVKKPANKYNNIYFFQHGKEQKINEFPEIINMDKNEFSIRFYNKKYNSGTKEFNATHIAALLDKNLFDKINIDVSTENISCFAPATGMAAGNSGYDALIFDSAGHHYLFYEDEDNKRLQLLEKGNVFHKLEFVVNRLYYNEQEIDIKDSDLEEFYLAIFTDRNFNEIIDKNELTKLVIRLK